VFEFAFAVSESLKPSLDNQEEKKDNFVIGIELLKIIRPTAAELIMECLEEN